MASDDQRMPQRDVLAQQLKTQMPSAAARQAQSLQLRQDGTSSAAMVAMNAEQYLVFSLLEREFAIKAEHIQGVERLTEPTPIPNVASWICGVINLRGSIVSVVDLRAFLDLEKLPYSPLTRLLSVQYNEMVICLIVDGVSEMVPIPPPWVAPYVSGSALLGKRVIVLLDAAHLLFAKKMQHYSLE